MHPLADNLERSPELFPLVWDPATDEVTLIRLTEVDYRQASFLDARILSPRTPRRLLAWQDLAAAAAATLLREAENYIFHIGHVGSTLLSRMLGAHPQVFALREPAILRTLAHVHSIPDRSCPPLQTDERLSVVLKLLSRTFRPEQRAIVKATSFVSELAVPILSGVPGAKAIFVFAPAETYLATILGAANSPSEARLLAEGRLTRLHRHIGQPRWKLSALSDGEMVAMSWVCEMTSLGATAELAGERAAWLDFDGFLQAPAEALAIAFRHFGIEANARQLDDIVSGPELRRYSKAQEHAYDVSLRRDVLEHARRKHAEEISRGLRWLEAADLPTLTRFPLG
ncbi:MAG: hypothetical protein ACJ8EL_15220 [Rhizomicrobium sp.]|jgi:hypothetical protein